MDDFEKMITALCAIEDGLSPWEMNFIENVSHIPVDELTEKQKQTIIALYERKT